MPYRLAIAHHYTKLAMQTIGRGWIEGLEPSASRATIWRASQLRHTHHVKKDISVIPFSVPKGIRTPDPRLRRPLLYPAELWTHILNMNYAEEIVLLNSACLFPILHIWKRVMGIEPTCPAWKAGVLPLNYTRKFQMLCAKSG